MSYQPQDPYRPPVVAGAAQVPGVPSPTPEWKPPKNRALPWLIAALVALVVIAGGLAAALVTGVKLPWPSRDEPSGTVAVVNTLPPLTEASAQRACRTAFRQEWEARDDVVMKDEDDVLASVQDIEVLETWKTVEGYGVNGTIHYSLTGALIGSIEYTLDLTCTASGTDGAPHTVVDNRN
jgi:hypothetical protein